MRILPASEFANPAAWVRQLAARETSGVFASGMTGCGKSTLMRWALLCWPVRPVWCLLGR